MARKRGGAMTIHGTTAKKHCWRTAISVCAGITCFLLISLSGQAQQPAVEPGRFGDWELSCTDSKSPCRLSQKLAIKDSGETVFALTILPGDKKNELVGIASIPLGGYIAPGIELRIDGKKAYKLLVETCNASGCHSGFPISQALQKELSSGKQATFRIWTTKAKPTDIRVSLAGMSRAFAALRDKTSQ